MNRVKEVERINKADLKTQLASDTAGDAGKWDVNKSWHAQYKDSAYVYVGGLPYDLSEGDVIVIFSQFGEIVDVNLPREKDTGKPKGFAFIAYEDQRSTVLAVDNFNGAKVLGRTLRCDHCQSFREEQKKDANALPEHVTRKLNDDELEKKKEEVRQRNDELDAAAEAKAALFAEGRGTAESERERDEREIRMRLSAQKEAAAVAKRTSHVEAVLARRKGEFDKLSAEEKRLQQEREERRQRKAEEMRKEAEAAQAKTVSTAPPPPPPPPPTSTAAQAASSVEASAAYAAVSESKWERMMNGGGGGKKDKKKKRHREREEERAEPKRHRERDDGPPGAKKPGEGISIDETNALRASLGLKPLRE